MHRLSVLCRLLVVACLSLAGLALPGAAAPAAFPTRAAASGPSGLSPANTPTGPVPMLSWSAARGAVRYHVEVAPTPDFSTLAYEATTTNVRATPTRTLPGGQMYWRVRAVSASGAPGAWSTAAFTVAAVAPPTLLSPVDGSLLQPPGDVPLLEWTDVSSADSYEVMVDTEPNFVSPEDYEVKSPTLLRRASHVPGTTYYWRVRAVADGQSGQWSPTWSWAAGSLQLPTVLRPANSSTAVVQDVVLEWTPVLGAVSYDVRISTDQAFTTVVHSDSTISTRYSPRMTLDNDQYWWQVRPRDTDGNYLDWAEVPTWQFQRSWDQAPQLVWPLPDASVAAPLFYQWSAIPHASRYRLDVSDDRNFSPGSVDTCYTTLTTYTAAGGACMPTPGAATYWRVRAIDDPKGVNSLYSAVRMFTYSSADVQELLPEPGAVVDVPSMSWEPAPHAKKYTVYLSRPSGTVSQYVTYSTSYTPQSELPAGTYGWQVIATLEDGTSTQPLRTYPRTFTVSDTPPEATSPSPEPLTPAVGAEPTSRVPALTWEPTVGAEYYKVVVSGPDTDRAYVTLAGQWEYPAATDPADDRFAAGTYRWFVEAFAATGTQPIATGSVGTFVIHEPQAVTGQSVSLSGTGLDDPASRCAAAMDDPAGSPQLCGNLRATPVLDWTPVPDAAFYLLYLSYDRSMTNRVPGYDGVPVPASRWAPTRTLADSQAGDAYYWAVRPCVSIGACGPEPDRAGHAFDKRSFPVSGLEPSGGTVSGQVTLSWDDYRTTNLATADASTGLLSDQGARQYQVQVATDATFKTLFEDEIVDQTTYTSRDTTYPDGTFFWRVRALDGGLLELPWSEAHMVTKTTPGPSPLAPADGGTLRSAQMLRWQPEAGVERYEVEVYENDDRLFSSEHLVRRVTSGFAATTFDVPLPASVQPYVWRVRRIDADLRPSQWSAARGFVVRRATVSLVAPASGYQPGRTLLFTWRPVTGAAGYRFERRGADGSLDERVITAGTSWAPLKVVPDGSHGWRVLALDAAGQELAASGWQDFKVDGTAPTVVGVAPSDVIRPAQDLRIAFSERVTGVGTGTVRLFQKGEQHPVVTRVRLASTGRYAVIDPKANLRVGRTYVLRVTTGIRDAAGNQVASAAWTVSAQR